MHPTDDTASPPAAGIEVTLPTALEMCQLGLGTLVDIRQAVELDTKGRIPDAVHIPLFEVKRMLGHVLTQEEQDVLDAGTPMEVDAMSFFATVNQLHNDRDKVLLCICNSGRRSIAAAELLRTLGYAKALSVAGGFQAWKKLALAQA